MSDELDFAQHEVARGLAESLAQKGFDILVWGDPEYPPQLNDLRSPPPVLYWAGELGLIARNGVGMCGSRRASEAGLRAARACGAALASSGLVVVSGNARGVDTEAHRAALEVGGATIMVLAEGPLHYRPRRTMTESADGENILILSQFPPQMTWNVGNAMTRNGVIAALGQALVVIEAGKEGGTLDAGLQGLAIGRPVIALQFETTETPAGNAILHSKGAVAVSSPNDLKAVIDGIAREGPAQQTLELGALL
jgi:DNA processing protein